MGVIAEGTGAMVQMPFQFNPRSSPIETESRVVGIRSALGCSLTISCRRAVLITVFSRRAVLA